MKSSPMKEILSLLMTRSGCLASNENPKKKDNRNYVEHISNKAQLKTMKIEIKCESNPTLICKKTQRIVSTERNFNGDYKFAKKARNPNT